MAFNAASLPRFSTTSTAPDPLQDVLFRFGYLLPELRDYVYDFYFADGDTKGSLIDLASIAEKRPLLSLTLVCRQAHDESLSRYKLAEANFGQDHEFWLRPTLWPDPTSFTCEPYWSFPDDGEATFQENYVQPEPRTQHTILGDFESDSFEISNVTTLGRFVNRLQLGYSPGQCQTTLVAWEALDQEGAKQSSDSKLYDRSGLTGDADSDYSTGSEQVGRVSEQGMLQSLTKFLRDESQERSSEMCGVTCAYGSFGSLLTPRSVETFHDVEESGNFILEGSPRKSQRQSRRILKILDRNPMVYGVGEYRTMVPLEGLSDPTVSGSDVPQELH